MRLLFSQNGKVLPEVTYQLALETLSEKQMAELVYLVANYCQLAVSRQSGSEALSLTQGTPATMRKPVLLKVH